MWVAFMPPQAMMLAARPSLPLHPFLHTYSVQLQFRHHTRKLCQAPNRACRALASKASRSSCTPATSASRSAHSAASHPSIMACRCGNRATSSIGGRVTSNARFSRNFSSRRTSCSPPARAASDTMASELRLARSCPGSCTGFCVVLHMCMDAPCAGTLRDFAPGKPSANVRLASCSTSGPLQWKRAHSAACFERTAGSRGNSQGGDQGRVCASLSR